MNDNYEFSTEFAGFAEFAGTAGFAEVGGSNLSLTTLTSVEGSKNKHECH